VQANVSARLTGGRSTKYLRIAIPAMSIAHRAKPAVNTVNRRRKLKVGDGVAAGTSLYVGTTSLHSLQTL
jgi:hypothetical protein